jgi:glutamyl-tRNA(Gln) amidotransferase subunit E
MDRGSLGLKCGLEIHQQLDTTKLFCNDRSELMENVKQEFRRRLRPTQSELGEVDAAAVEEAKRNLAFVYQATPNSCLVEADEEPPHPCNEEALDVALTLALMVNARIIDEIHFMRKIVIDGSNTTGFQRSALVATDGWFELDGKRYGVPSILLEEDAARKVEERDGEVVYRLDRLGIPLIEVNTTPNIEAPDEAAKVALRIGTLLRTTRKVKRGIGTIREDVNVSITGGARTETKGVQELRMISTFVEREVARQKMLIEVAEELAARGASRPQGTAHDVTGLFAATTSKVVASAIAAGGKVLALSLPGFAGLLKGKIGPELAARARVAGVGGILHSDELPGMGVTAEEVAAVAGRLAVGSQDAFVLVATEERRGRRALHEVVNRAAEAFRGVPPETRDPRADGTTTYSRPLPGRARMYPETDVPPIRVTRERLERLRAQLPEMPEVRLARIIETHGLPRQQAAQLIEDGIDDALEAIVQESGEPQAVANALTYQFAEIRREDIDVDAIPLERLRELFRMFANGAFAKEAIPDLLRAMARDRTDAGTAAKSLGLAAMSERELDAALDAIVAAHGPMIRERGDRALPALMGVAMGQLRGRADGAVISEKLRARVAANLGSNERR